MKLTREMLLEEGYKVDGRLTEAIYILPDGTLWDGGFEYKSRCVEHREVEAFSEYNRYDGDKFWIDVMVNMGLIMVIPETHEMLIHPDNRPTKEQYEMIKLMPRHYTVAKFT